MILYINTSESGFVILAFIKDEEVFLTRRKVGRKQSEKALFLLDNFLVKNKFKLQDIKKIVVNRGPGSFTSVRLGVVLANTLAFGLKTFLASVDNCVFENKDDYLALKKLKFNKEFVKPYYDREPNITKSKKKNILKK